MMNSLRPWINTVTNCLGSYLNLFMAIETLSSICPFINQSINQSISPPVKIAISVEIIYY